MLFYVAKALFHSFCLYKATEQGLLHTPLNSLSLSLSLCTRVCVQSDLKTPVAHLSDAFQTELSRQMRHATKKYFNAKQIFF